MEHQHGHLGVTDPARSSTLFAEGPGDLAGGVLDLQQSIGNAAVSGLLEGVQRDEVDGAVDQAPDLPLDDAAAAAAISYYRAQPAQYTPDIVNQIQAAVGLPETGTIDAATVQAVARWQRDEGDNDPPLVVDGKAGPRTLPRLFSSGLNAPGEGAAFGEAAQTGVIDRWGELTPQERGAELVRLVNVHLESAGVPPVTPNVEDGGNDLGTFDFTPWQMNIGEVALQDEHLTREEAADVVNTIYHEARHAEQWFRMAQMRAGQGRTAAQIATELDIRPDVAQAAVDDPLDRGSMEALVAKGWYDSVYGSGSAHRETTLGEVDDADTALDEAVERFEADPTPENEAAVEAARERRSAAFAAYQELPEENDAWATGPMAEAGVTSGSPEPEENQSATEAETPAATGGGPTADQEAADTDAPDMGEMSGPPPELGPSELGPLAEELAVLLASFTGEQPEDLDVEAAP